MKKFFIALVFLIGSIGVNAQSTWPSVGANSVRNMLSYVGHAVTDTIVDATAENQYAICTGASIAVTAQVLLTKGTGTPAGTLNFQGSNDGVIWKTIGTDALTNTTTQQLTYTLAPSHYQYYRVNVVASGTQNTYITTKILHRK